MLLDLSDGSFSLGPVFFVGAPQFDSTFIER